MKKFFIRNFIVFMAIFFALPTIFMFYHLSVNNTKYQHILDNGIEVEAEIIPDSYRSSGRVNETTVYKIDFIYIDHNGEKHNGTTLNSYSYFDINILIRQGTITIKYDPETFDSIEASYNASKDKNMVTIFAIAFTCADLALWGIAIAIVINNLKKKKAEKYGKEYTATVTNYKHTLSTNNVRKYTVYYTWVGENGISYKGSSGSRYLLEEAEALQQAKNITIKAIGKSSVIISTPDLCINNHYNKTEDSHADNSELKCEYCGHTITKTDQYCNHCGAKVNFYE